MFRRRSVEPPAYGVKRLRRALMYAVKNNGETVTVFETTLGHGADAVRVLFSTNPFYRGGEKK